MEAQTSVTPTAEGQLGSHGEPAMSACGRLVCGEAHPFRGSLAGFLNAVHNATSSAYDVYKPWIDTLSFVPIPPNLLDREYTYDKVWLVMDESKLNLAGLASTKDEWCCKRRTDALLSTDFVSSGLNRFRTSLPRYSSWIVKITCLCCIPTAIIINGMDYAIPAHSFVRSAPPSTTTGELKLLIPIRYIHVMDFKLEVEPFAAPYGIMCESIDTEHPLVAQQPFPMKEWLPIVYNMFPNDTSSEQNPKHMFMAITGMVRFCSPL